jgi:ABC-2 type transport system ATP-binding protein
MRQKVAIALAILRDTDILLLDEPTSGLDPMAIDEFHTLVRGLADAGKAILMVTHDVYGACQVADRIGLLHAGRLVDQFAAPAGQRIDTETVHRAFSAQGAAQRAHA